MGNKEKYLYPTRIPRPKDFKDFNEDWYVGLNGDLLGKRTGYHIPHYDLERDHWFVHLKDKMWFDADTFLPAYFKACEMAGIKVVKLRIDY